VSATLRDPQDVLAAVARHPANAPLVLDFDETLWLRNSTEMFLDSVRPRFLAAIVLQLLGIIKPWRLFRRSAAYRDWIRVVAVLVVAPWSLARWRRQAAKLGPQYVNADLLAAVRARPIGETAVVSFGFAEIIRPLLTNIDKQLRLLESCTLRSGAKLRLEGKAKALERHMGSDRLRGAMAVTDSLADTDLLEVSAQGLLVEWPDAHYEQAGLKPLMPFVYLQRVKRPDENYIRNAIFGHDLPVLILAYAMVSAQPLAAIASILIFVLAFFTSYETGYHENDKLGLKLEAKPKVSAQYHLLGRHFSPAFAWSVAILLSGIASLIAYRSASWIPSALGTGGLVGFLAVWTAFVGFLLFMRLLFRWQNVVEPQGRTVPMLGLQVGRVLGYALVFPTSVIGALFCVAHGISRWLPYVIYRFGGSRKDVPNHLNNFMLLVLFGLAVAIGGGLQSLLTWQAALIFGYAGLRAGKDLLSFRKRLRPLTPLGHDDPEHTPVTASASKGVAAEPRHVESAPVAGV
jgi:phosphoserine phosphatase